MRVREARLSGRYISPYESASRYEAAGESIPGEGRIVRRHFIKDWSSCVPVDLISPAAAYIHGRGRRARTYICTCITLFGRGCRADDDINPTRHVDTCRHIRIYVGTYDVTTISDLPLWIFHRLSIARCVHSAGTPPEYRSGYHRERGIPGYRGSEHRYPSDAQLLGTHERPGRLGTIRIARM